MAQNRFFTLFFATVAVIFLTGGWTAHAQMAQWKMSRRAGHKQVQAFVTLHSAADTASLRSCGATILGTAGNVTMIKAPASAMEQIAATRGVKRVSPAQRVDLCNDVARDLSRADEVKTSPGSSLPPYTGRDVVVGMVDVGFDFNHINFSDAQGKSRVAAVYLPCDHSGESPVIDGETLPGSHYTTPAQIAQLTTDDTHNSHGTHTTGTAAGSYRANGLHGIAPEATLVLCGMPDDSLTDVNIALAVKYIFDYAARVGKPAVVNMSIGSHSGAHDGSSMLCHALDEMSGSGRICVLSAGNDGAIGCHISHTFAGETDTLRTFFADWTPATPIFYGSASAWSASEKPHEVEIGVWNIKADTLCMRQKLVFPQDESIVIDCNEGEWSRYFTGTIEAAAALESNERYHSIVGVNLQPVDAALYRLFLFYTAPGGETLEAWTGVDSYFTRYSHEGWTSGNSSVTISDLATGDRTLSVGAYCSKNNIATDWGDILTWTRSTPTAVAHFSSRGPDCRGIMRPDVLAPGFAVVSSASRYDEQSAIAHSRRVTEVTVDGVTYPYGAQEGTSMSTPVVTGAVALCLQLNPRLTPEQVREAIAASSVRDDDILNAAPEQVGNGKLDVTALVRHVAAITGDANGDGICNGADITTVTNAILSPTPPSWGTGEYRNFIYDWLLQH